MVLAVILLGGTLLATSDGSCGRCVERRPTVMLPVEAVQRVLLPPPGNRLVVTETVS